MDRQKWLSNILFGGLCLIIPAIGPIVFSGYLFEVIDSLKRDPEHKYYPDFDFNRFMPYLMRGIWPFLVRLVVSLVIGLALGVAVVVLMAIGGAIAAAADAPALILLFQLLAFVIILAIGILSNVVIWPAEIQAGLGREFNLSRVIAFVKDFNKRVLKELVISALFLVGITIVAEIVGCAAFCVGFYFTIAAVVMAQHHLFFQLYVLYLERGGTPVVPATSESVSDEQPADQPRPRESAEPDDRFRAER
jgi:hypothetical protein